MQEQIRKALKEIHGKDGIDVTSSVFQAVFKRNTLKLLEAILDDKETYNVK